MRYVTYFPVPLDICVAQCVTIYFTLRRLNKNFIMNGCDIGVVGILVGLSVILFEVFPEESVWSIPVRQADEHMIAVPVRRILFIRAKKEAYKTLIKE